MLAPTDLAATKACPCLAARRHARTLTRHFDAYLRPHGVRSTQFSVLAALGIGGPKPVGVLADALGLERTTLTRSTATLERNGWVASGASADGRERPLELTDAGRRVLDRALPAWRAALDEVALDEVLPEGAATPSGVPAGGSAR